ncbi:putative hydroxymethylpyrimidine transporter CytX [bacterium M00.F.Ca.ET.228.01.1.1]|uniref:putative hydroxymethylpyrimidine transporter CytX n=1 Tax=Paraburkholderia phenoliruptrix TaxID=252970 RepID=UPI001091AD77|nr:putative hydroxymethylpyrimidine transporter CytX [Paraburkholderia phenoliruptrix]TGP43243.1 putative hydroxymethylpyrimidine transporter CytX [bacterium M00.F.Ca.ET.228.01.1.1]TGS00682.1 putative hydroxymethylpyrimidine transporter CytX [bacterium M00.F.Ca.ET.191.01.1.1]TGU05068.1 putative hydroxymethylpyrimidine transporter CytX [bacterium M00.F.Ca.ET.155.01.1.1]MBW0446819.1 putative hydroxymethylpyrimidine transporter CytX [Paraburkholderia phenoliruptrix]MBW9099315.1 putative hydroxyme
MTQTTPDPLTGDAGSTYAPLTPVPDARRAFGTGDAFALWFSLGIGLLVAQAGALLVPGLSLAHALLAIAIGSAIGVVLLALAGVIGTDTGLAAMSSLRPTLGVRGASVPAVLNAVQLVGWGAFEVIVMRDSADALAKQAFGFSMPLIWTVVFGLLATLLAISGPLSFVRRFLRTWGIWLLLAGAAWLTWNLLAQHDLAAMLRKPGTGEMSFGGAIDLVVAMPLSWLPLIADYTRFGRRAGETFRGTLLGYGIANLWFYALGAVYGLAAGGGDALLTSALAQAGGGLALLLILIDEVDNAFADIHSAAVSTGTFWARGSVPMLSAAFGALCTLIALLVPMAKYQNFLLLIGSVFAPLFGVVLVDHFIVRKRRIEAAALADVRGRYGFSAGWHLSAFIAWAIGIAAYQAINQWLPNLGATLPSLIIGAVCYLVFVSTRKTAYA